MAEMTVQRALNELKIIDERLSKRLTEFVVVGTKKFQKLVQLKLVKALLNLKIVPKVFWIQQMDY